MIIILIMYNYCRDQNFLIEMKTSLGGPADIRKIEVSYNSTLLKTKTSIMD